MAEFQVVAKELERMCNTYHAVSGKCGTDECPLYCEFLCYAQAMVHVHSDDAYILEKVVMAWAAEHPDPVYPTWLEYIMDAQPDCVKAYNGGNDTLWKWMWTTPIPADIAEKLGVRPKEGV